MSENTVADVHRLLTEQIGDALIYAAPDGSIVAWNRAAETLFGFVKAEAIGQGLDLIIPEKLRPAHWAGFDRAMALGAVQPGRKAMITRAQTRAGNAIYVEMSFAVVCDDGGKAIGAVAVARDATQRHQDDKALRERLAALEKSQRLPAVNAADRFDLERFVAAQADHYATAVAELRAGRKRTHWMWFVFPQYDGLGFSATAKFYAIKSLAEARAYLAHPLLGARLIECAEIVAGLSGRTLGEIFGYPDELKFCSSMTLFERAAGPDAPFSLALDRCCGGQRDPASLKLLSLEM